MTRSLCRLLQVLIAISAGPCLAGGTLDSKELEPLIRQQPTVREALLSSLVLSNSAYAELRLGSHFIHLGGARVGPYTIKATLKESHKEVEVILCTKARFLDDQGSELLEDKRMQATRIDEKLIIVILKEPSTIFASPECP